jgi:NodT family efflux transporter outer membrane factor (OMF) lipoprotein
MKPGILAILIFALSGCGSVLESDYQRPTVSVPDGWRVRDSGPAWLHGTPHWWDNFQDPLLSSTIDSMLLSNSDLAKAGLLLQEARLSAGLANTTLLPDATLGGSANRSSNLKGSSNTAESYSAVYSLSYELDLWGKLSSSRRQAEWLVKASEQDRQNTALTLVGTTADFYWQIAMLNQQIDAQKSAAGLAEQTLRLVNSRYRAGAAGRVEYLQAQQSLMDKQNQLTALDQQRETARNSLALLFNGSPLSRRAEKRSQDYTQQIAVAQSLPVATLAARPDVQAAEWRLRAALSGSDVARLSFFPSVSLNASLNAGSTVFQQWFNNPVGALGSAVALPFVQWNTVRLTIAQSDLKVQEAAIDFRQAVYTALSEVDNAQTQRVSYLRQREQQLENQRLSEERVALAQSQYRAGAISLQSLLDAQDALLSSEISLANLHYGYLNATMKLWLALGGGVAYPKNEQGHSDEQ